MKLPNNVDFPGLPIGLIRYLRDIARQVNGITEGQAYAFHGAMTAAPTTGSFAQGDLIRKSDPVEAGAAGSKYVIWGYLCVASGTPGTWVELRALTGA
jgi:hypothetical protein